MSDRIAVRTPRGTAYYPSLARTETYKGKDTGNYVCKLILEGEALEEMKKTVTEFLDDTYGPKKAKTAKTPFKQTKDGKHTYITFKAKAEIKGEPRVVAIFDRKGNPVKQELAGQIGNGSIIRVSGSLSAWAEEPGCSFYMDSVKVIKLVKFVPGGGWDAEEDDDEDGGDEFGTGGSSTSSKPAKDTDPDDDVPF